LSANHAYAFAEVSAVLALAEPLRCGPYERRYSAGGRRLSQPLPLGKSAMRQKQGPQCLAKRDHPFFRDSLSAWRQRSGTLSDASQWLQQRSDNNTDLKSATQELQQQCDNQFMQCALTCIDSAVPAAPSTPQPP